MKGENKNMACCINNNISRTTDCITNLLKKINTLQRNAIKSEDESCARDYLGNPCICQYNTRPIVLYNCGGGTFEYPVSNDCSEDTPTSCILRVESVDNGCVTCRVLIQTDDQNPIIEPTNSFVTIKIDCICSCRCLPDAYLDICF